MKKVFLFLFTLLTLSSFGQKLQWIPFNWDGVSVDGRYFDKAAIMIPVTIENLPHKFNMQLDLGAVTTNFYGNALNAYMEKYPFLQTKIDTALTFHIQGQKNNKFRNVLLKLGGISFEKRDIGYFKNYGDTIPADSIMTPTEKHIGTIAPDLFKNKILIIDFPKKRICVTDNLPSNYKMVIFQHYEKASGGRIKIPFTINNKTEYLLFDTGSSLFTLLTTEDRAKEISNNIVIDSLKLQSWGVPQVFYGKKVNTKIKFGPTQLKNIVAYYVNQEGLEQFFQQQKIFGITGNALFLNNVVVIDYKNERFGVK